MIEQFAPSVYARMIHERFAGDSELADAYERHIRLPYNLEVRPKFRVYDVVNWCNLKCDGCFFWERYTDHDLNPPDRAAWDRFWDEQVADGVSLVHIAGGEPAFAFDSLQSANERFRFGLVYTNGTRYIPEEVWNKRLCVSLYGDREVHNRLKNAKCFDKIMKVVNGDKRVLFAYMVAEGNVEDIPHVVQIARDAGVGIYFTFYTTSANTSYELIPTAKSLARCRELIAEQLALYPETVVWSDRYNDLACTSGVKEPLTYDNCVTKNGFSYKQGKFIKTCGYYMEQPEDCRFCRVTSGLLPTVMLGQRIAWTSTRDSFLTLLDAYRLYFRIFSYNPDLAELLAN